jgi:hypothetical protein
MRVGDSVTRDGQLSVERAERAAGQTAGESGAPRRPPDDEPSPFARILRGLGREMDAGERLMSGVVHQGGTQLGSGDLLALQAGVYRYSEAVDLSAKLVDRAANGVKTVLQGQ